jgi:hypothetical protein
VYLLLNSRDDVSPEDHGLYVDIIVLIFFFFFFAACMLL